MPNVNSFHFIVKEEKNLPLSLEEALCLSNKILDRIERDFFQKVFAEKVGRSVENMWCAQKNKNPQGMKTAGLELIELGEKLNISTKRTYFSNTLTA